MSKKQQPQKQTQEEPQAYRFDDEDTITYRCSHSWLENGKMLRMKRSDFPKGRNGALAYAEYKIAVAVDYRERITRRSDPLAKTRNRVAKMRAKLAALEAELAQKEKQS